MEVNTKNRSFSRGRKGLSLSLEKQKSKKSSVTNQEQQSTLLLFEEQLSSLTVKDMNKSKNLNFHLGKNQKSQLSNTKDSIPNNYSHNINRNNSSNRKNKIKFVEAYSNRAIGQTNALKNKQSKSDDKQINIRGVLSSKCRKDENIYLGGRKKTLQKRSLQFIDQSNKGNPNLILIKNSPPLVANFFTDNPSRKSISHSKLISIIGASHDSNSGGLVCRQTNSFSEEKTTTNNCIFPSAETSVEVEVRRPLHELLRMRKVSSYNCSNVNANIIFNQKALFNGQSSVDYFERVNITAVNNCILSNVSKENESTNLISNGSNGTTQIVEVEKRELNTIKQLNQEQQNSSILQNFLQTDRMRRSDKQNEIPFEKQTQMVKTSIQVDQLRSRQKPFGRTQLQQIQNQLNNLLSQANEAKSFFVGV